MFLLYLVLPLKKFKMYHSWNDFVHHIGNEVEFVTYASWMLHLFEDTQRQ